MNKTVLIVLGLVVGLIVGGGGAYALDLSQTSVLFSQINTLQTQLTTVQNQAQTLQSDKNSLQNTVNQQQSQISSLQASLSTLQSKYDTLYWSSPKPVDVEKFVTNLMAKRGQPWEPSRYNADIQALLIINIGESWADKIRNDVVEKLNNQGGAGVPVGRYASESLGPNVRYLEDFLNEAAGKALVEKYGIEHTGVLYIGGPEMFTELADIYKNPAYPMSNKIPWIYLNSNWDIQFGYIFNAPYGD